MNEFSLYLGMTPGRGGAAAAGKIPLLAGISYGRT